MMPFNFVFFPLTYLLFFFGFHICCKGKHKEKKRGFIFFLVFLTIVMIVLSITIRRTIYDDIERMTQEMIASNTEGIAYFFKYPTYRISPLSAITLYLIGLTHQYYLAQGFAALCFYSSLCFIAWTLYKYSKYTILPTYLALMLVFFYPLYPSIIFGVRSWSATSICIALIIYMEYAHKKKITCAVLILVACLFHIQAAFVLFIYLISKLNGYILYLIQIILVLYGWVAVPISSIAYSVLPDNVFIHDIHDKISYYFIGGSNYTVYTSGMQIAFSIAIPFTLAIAFFFYKFILQKITNRITQEKLLLSNSYEKFLITFFCFYIGSLASFTSLSRYAAIMFLLCFPLFVNLINDILLLSTVKQYKNICKISFAVLGAVILIFNAILAWKMQSMFWPSF